MMKIGCFLDRRDGVIAELFSKAEYVVVIDAENYTVLSAFERGEMTEVELARWVLKEDCEAIITGPLEQAPFEIIAEEGMITRYNGVGLEAMTSIRMMNGYRLDLIPDFIGGTGCGSGGECHDHSHDHHH